MRASEVVARLIQTLPQLTDAFTKDVPVLAVVRTGSVVEVRCGASHDLAVGDAFALVGARTPISISSLTRAGTLGTLVCATRHDLTQAILGTISISGANEPSFNGDFVGVRVVDRFTIEFEMADAGPTTATGSPILLNGESYLRDYNATYPVLQITGPASFTFEDDRTTLPNPVGSIVARVKPRVTAIATAERAIAAYTEQAMSDLWLFVVLEDVVASKDRNIRSDAVSNLQRGNFFRQQIVAPFTLYLFIPASHTIGGRQTRDAAENLFRPICRSVLFHKFDTGLYAARQGTANFVSHGTFAYDGAVYVHAFAFSQVQDLTFEDTVGHDRDVAFRDLEMRLFPVAPGGTRVEHLLAAPDLSEPAEEV